MGAAQHTDSLALAVENEGPRHTLGANLAQHAAIAIEQNRGADAVSGHDFAAVVEPATDHDENEGRVLAVVHRGLELGQLPNTGSSSGRPEIDQDALSIQNGGVERATVHHGERQVPSDAARGGLAVALAGAGAETHENAQEHHQERRR